MLTLDEWKQLRRVDRINIDCLNIHLRWRNRGIDDTPLKSVDTYLADYGNVAYTGQDRIHILGDLILIAGTYLRNQVSRKRNAVMQRLHDEAATELGVRIGRAAIGTALVTDIVVAGNNEPLQNKRVYLNIYLVVLPADVLQVTQNLNQYDQEIDRHLQVANQLWGPASIQISRNPGQNHTRVIATTNDAVNTSPQILDNNGTFDGDPEAPGRKLSHLITHSDRTNPAVNPQPINVYYVPDFKEVDVFGLTSRHRITTYAFEPPEKNFVIINYRYRARESTFAHELGHALIDDGSHTIWDKISDHTENLMCSGADRSPNHNLLFWGQMGAGRINDYAF